MNYIKISEYDTANGLGVGSVLWVSGCGLHCHNCHNPSTWDFNAGQQFTDETMQKLFETLDKPYITRLTISGGHPLEPENLETVSNIVLRVKEKFPEKSIWLYTGYTWRLLITVLRDTENDFYEHLSKIMRNIDVLVDGKYIDEQRDISLPFRGSSNQRIIDVQKSLNNQVRNEFGRLVISNTPVLYQI